MGAQYTPGPWLVEDPFGEDQGDALWIVQEGATPAVFDWRCLAIVTSDDPDDRDLSASAPVSAEERNANARLIAEAPVMAQALRTVLVCLGDTERDVACKADIRAILARIDGEGL